MTALSRAAEPVPASSIPSEIATSLIRQGMREASFVHDPSTILREGPEFWFFSTGQGISSWHSKDLDHWQRGPQAFPEPPSWITNVVSTQRGHFWAPDVIFHMGRYLLYYSVSRFGVNTSAIALASNATLDPNASNYHWKDEGIVITSSRTNDFNAIDPQVIRTASNDLWLAFGSFWSGIKLVQLNPSTGLRLKPDSPLHSLASHPQIEAPAIYQHDGFFYLFVNWGFCCRGTNSTYEIRVGRAPEITGPYLDKNGVDMRNDGGTLLLGRTGAFIGPGHAGFFEANGSTWISCHFYNGAQRGAATLAIRPLRWSPDGWPSIGELPSGNSAPPSASLEPAGPHGKAP